MKERKFISKTNKEINNVLLISLKALWLEVFVRKYNSKKRGIESPSTLAFKEKKNTISNPSN